MRIADNVELVLDINSYSCKLLQRARNDERYIRSSTSETVSRFLQLTLVCFGAVRLMVVFTG